MKSWKKPARMGRAWGGVPARLRGVSRMVSDMVSREKTRAFARNHMVAWFPNG